MPKCKCCQKDKPIDDFPLCGKHTKKSGDTVEYRRETCRACFAGRERLRYREKQREEFRRLVGWPATMLGVTLAIVVGTFQYDSVSGRNRTCTYLSVYGYHSVTIDAMQMCPLTYEFEV